MELNKALLDCMQSLRRRLRDEQVADIRLSQPDAVEAMLLACLRSSDQDTRNLGIRLAELSDFHGTTATTVPVHPARQYRGHELPEPEAEAEAEAEAASSQSADEEPRGHSVRMYRGQRVFA